MTNYDDDREGVMREYNAAMSRRRHERKRNVTAQFAGPARRWTPEEDAVVLRDDIWLMEMCFMLKRTYASVVGRRRRLRG